jgi:hypothetical protein
VKAISKFIAVIFSFALLTCVFYFQVIKAFHLRNIEREVLRDSDLLRTL